MSLLIETTVIDNVLPVGMADEIERTMLSSYFPWYYLPDITYVQEALAGKDRTPAMSHTFVEKQGKQSSDFYGLIRAIPHVAMEKAFGKTFSFVYQVRSFMQMPLRNSREHNNVHIDYEFPHAVCLYYLNDTDGDTFLFDSDRQTVIKRVTPKKNRALLFDGSLYHASSSPTEVPRAILNFNLIL